MKFASSLVLATAAALAHVAPAEANPHPLPFSYPYETLPAGKFEIEQYLDYVPVRVARENPDGTLEGVWGMRSVLTTELELGLTDRLEAGFYLSYEQGASATAPFLQFTGIKQRLRYRFAETGELPVDIGLYLEIAEKHDELEFEEKILLSKRVGALVLVANLWVEQEWYFQESATKYIYNPTAGVAYEISPRFHVGLEYWARGRFDDTSGDTATTDVPVSTHHYAGPTFLYQQGQVFLALGAYARLDKLGDTAIVEDPYGKVWFRTILGLEL